MADISERHEVRVDSGEHSFVFVADSTDGRLVIREEDRSGRTPREVCALTLSNPGELRDFFEGLRRVLGATCQPVAVPAVSAASAGLPARGGPATAPARANDPEERDALIAEARQRNPNAFQPWTGDEERQVRERFEKGEAIPAIARAHRRSPKAIELRLKRLGVLKQE